MRSNLDIAKVTKVTLARSAAPVLVSVLAAVTGCSQGSSAPGGSGGGQEPPALQVADTLGTAVDSAHAPELAGLMQGTVGPPMASEAEAFRCDPNPQITMMNVCGHTFPASIHFQWTACEGGPESGPRPGMKDHPHRSSSGVLDITHTITPPASGCVDGAVLTFARTATYQIDRSGPRGDRSLSGSVTSTSQHVAGAMAFTEAMTLDTERARKDASGALVRSLHLTGSLGVAFDTTNGARSRTFGGTLKTDAGGGKTAQLTLTGVVRVPHAVCRTPLSGTIVRTAADGTPHTLAFGPECGSATLDGKIIPFGRGFFGGHPGHGGPF